MKKGATFTSFSVSYIPSLVSVEPLLTVIAIPTLRLMSAFPAHATTRVSGQLIQFHVESTMLGMEVAVTS